MSYLLLLGGLVGLRARHAGAYGGAGRAGFRLAFAGLLLEATLGLGATVVAEALVGRALPPTVAGLVGFLISLAFLVGQFGLLLVGVATLRAGVLPMPFRALPLAIFLIGVPPALLVLLVFGLDYVLGAATEAPAWVVAQEALIGLLWALLGWALFSGAGTGARRPATAR